MPMVSDFTWRTPLQYTIAEQEPVVWRAVDDAAIAETIGGIPTPLPIVDLSPLPRLGFKGRETIAAMQARGIAIEPQPNRAFRQADGSLCLVLGAGDVFLLGALSGENAGLSALEAGWSLEKETRCYPLPRRDSHAWFAICGKAAPAMFAKICAVDLRLDHFPDLAIAQTSVARISAIVLRVDIGGRPVFHLLFDRSAAQYMLACLVDAASEFGGRLSGFHTLPHIPAAGECEGYGETAKE
jgi:sarcosine oxidase subunit gamma